MYFPSSEQLICRCNLPCRQAGHFHCSMCGKTLIRKDNVESHLINCKKRWVLAQLAWDPSSQPPSPETPPDVLSLYTEHSYLLSPSVYAVKFDHTYIMTESPESPAADTDIPRDEESSSEPEEPETSPSTPAPTSVEPITPDREEPSSELPPNRVRCPDCQLVLYKRNLALHIQRKHSRVKDTTASSQSKSLSLTNKSVSTQSEFPPGDGVVFQCTCRARFGQSNAWEDMRWECCRRDHLITLMPLPARNNQSTKSSRRRPQSSRCKTGGKKLKKHISPSLSSMTSLLLKIIPSF